MADYTPRLLKKYRRSGILVDTNLLLLFFVGSLNRELIGRFKRTDQFTTDDFDRLVGVLDQFKIWITTPNILTEVSNLSGQLGELIKSQFFDKFASGIDSFSELYIPSNLLARTPEFKRFGITDASLIQAAKGKHLILTEDYRLSQYLLDLHIDVINFNHIRGLLKP